MNHSPGGFIERTVDAGFEGIEQGFAVSVVRLSTVAGGVFDAEVSSLNCDDNGTLDLSALSGGVTFPGRGGPCYARLRFVVPASGVALTIRGHKATTFHMTCREPR
ncbi:MAG: hypothetical protein ABIT71_05305 [Vicinamibacteraceae bacterium]